ncbi:MAG: acetylglucosamine-6-sulfatase, partial [Planctomycetaceae bacterium]|nr:acetylglucosamine-6-sulfatase [Planctomycetaceae bacterium]
RDWKYIYWPYDEEGCEPTEELYHIAQDPLELKNLIDDPKHADDLIRLRMAYDYQLADWQGSGAPHHGYPALAQKFKRVN